MQSAKREDRNLLDKDEGGRQQEVNISDQNDLIQALLDRKISEVTLAAAERNIRALQKLKEQYQSNAFTDIIRELSKSYRDAVAALGSAPNSG